MTQVFFVHGGMTFGSREKYLSWLRSREVFLDDLELWGGRWLEESLGESFHLVKPRFPCKEFARYEEWRIHFERFLPLLEDGVVLVGSSLGGIFLAKYLSEHRVPKRVGKVVLVAPPFDDSLSDEELAGGFELDDDLSLILENCPDTTLFFSADDKVVPVEHAEKYAQALPGADVVVLEGKNGHFLVPELPEVLGAIRG